MNEQLTAIKDKFEIMEADFTQTYVYYPDPHELELHSEKDKEVREDIPNKSMDESVIHWEEVHEFEFENVDSLGGSTGI
jgi:hypothetical protein